MMNKKIAKRFMREIEDLATELSKFATNRTEEWNDKVVQRALKSLNAACDHLEDIEDSVKESRRLRGRMLNEYMTYYVSAPDEEYPHEFHSATEAKRFMKQHPGSTGEKVRVRSNGEWEPCGKIVLSGRNSVRMSDRKSYAYESHGPCGRMLKEDYWTDGTTSWINGKYDYVWGSVEVNTRLGTIALEYDKSGDNELFFQGDEGVEEIERICDIYVNKNTTPSEAVEIWASQF